MKKNKKDYIELTIPQLVLVGVGIVAFAVLGALWVTGGLWQYGMPLA